MLILASLIGYIWLISDLTEGRWIEEDIRLVDSSQRRMDLSSEDLEDLRREMNSISTKIAKLKAISGSFDTGHTTGQTVPDMFGDMLCAACSLLTDEAKRQKCRTRYCSKSVSQSLSQKTLGGRYTSRGTYRNARDFLVGMRRIMARRNNFRNRRLNIRNRY